MATNDWSVPESDVVDTALEYLDADRRAVLVTVVAVEGSAYRRPGAKMLVTPDGDGVGAITAGCLEDEVLAIAESVLDDGHPRVETYDLMSDDEDDVWGLGLGCDGIIDVLLEPVDESLRPALEASAAGDRIGALAVLDGETVEHRAYYRPGEGFEPAPGEGRMPDWFDGSLEGVAADLTDRGKAETVTREADGRERRVFVDGIAPPPELVVCGTGHDVGPVVELATRNDFRVTVAGFRGADDAEERFAAADDVVVTSPAGIREAYERGFDRDTYVVVMTHNFLDDRILVEELLETDVPYVGLMGPHDRFEEMLEEMTADGTRPPESDLDRVYTPVGLDLGGGAPYQIATSIVAEVMAVHNDRDPGHLSAREGAIHEPVEPGVSDD